MITHSTEIKLFAGNSNRKLAEAIAKELEIPLSDVEVGRFSDGEIRRALIGEYKDSRKLDSAIAFGGGKPGTVIKIYLHLHTSPIQ